MKIIITENQKRKLQFNYLDYLFKDMYEVESKKYPNYTRSWKKNGEIILEFTVESGYLWVLELIWSDISNMFSLDYDETKQLIKDWAEQHLELEGITPESVYGFFWDNN
jgi:hypothetical protein